jgi:hypothetical protein
MRWVGDEVKMVKEMMVVVVMRGLYAVGNLRVVMK